MVTTCFTQNHETNIKPTTEILGILNFNCSLGNSEHSQVDLKTNTEVKRQMLMFQLYSMCALSNLS